MKVLLLSQNDNGGAARSTRRLHAGLRKINIDSTVLVQSKSTKTEGVITHSKRWNEFSNALKLRGQLDRVPLHFYPRRSDVPFSPQWVPDRIPSDAKSISPDVVNLHWVGHGFLSIGSLRKFKSPLVWTLHDMWAFTGGCHYAGECDGYTRQCGTCPQLGSKRENDLSRSIWQRKGKSWDHLDLTIVTPSQWLARCARQSSLFGKYRIEVIPYGIDLQTYKPLNQSAARNALNLPQDKKLILFGAILGVNNPRKGFHLLKEALKKLKSTEMAQYIELVVFGNASKQDTADLGFKIHALGHLYDDYSLSLAYSAADAFIAPSLEDNLPNTIIEASACGTPSVGFEIGGIPDLIDHLSTGYLCKPFDTDDLMQGISWVIGDKEKCKKLGKASRRKAESTFNLLRQADAYSDLFSEILSKGSDKVPQK